MFVTSDSGHAKLIDGHGSLLGHIGRLHCWHFCGVAHPGMDPRLFPFRLADRDALHARNSRLAPFAQTRRRGTPSPSTSSRKVGIPGLWLHLSKCLIVVFNHEFLRGTDIALEFDRMKENAQQMTEQKQTFSFRDIRKETVYKPLGITLALMFFQQFTVFS